MSSSFGAAGQRCLAGSVAVVVGDDARQDEVVSALRDARPRARRRPGDADGVEVCPLVGPEARERVVGALDARPKRALKSSSTAVTRPTRGPGGTLLGPTIVETSTPNPRSRATSSSARS